MKRNIILVVFVFASVLSQAQTKEEKEVAGSVQILRAAMISGNKASLEKITGDQLTYGHSNGRIEDKAAFVEQLASGKSDFVTMDLTEQTIQIVDPTLAFVRHKLHGETMDGGKAGEANLGVLTVWQKQKGSWKLIARQAFKL
jgi:ketosteroid isomerase-like protein